MFDSVLNTPVLRGNRNSLRFHLHRYMEGVEIKKQKCFHGKKHLTHDKDRNLERFLPNHYFS